MSASLSSFRQVKYTPSLYLQTWTETWREVMDWSAFYETHGGALILICQLLLTLGFLIFFLIELWKTGILLYFSPGPMLIDDSISLKSFSSKAAGYICMKLEMYVHIYRYYRQHTFDSYSTWIFTYVNRSTDLHQIKIVIVKYTHEVLISFLEQSDNLKQNELTLKSGPCCPCWLSLSTDLSKYFFCW